MGGRGGRAPSSAPGLRFQGLILPQHTFSEIWVIILPGTSGGHCHWCHPPPSAPQAPTPAEWPPVRLSLCSTQRRAAARAAWLCAGVAPGPGPPPGPQVSLQAGDLGRAGGQVGAPRGPWVGGPQAGSPPGVSPLLRAWPQSTGAKPWRGGDSFPRMLGAGPALPASSQSWRPPISPRAAGQPHFDAPAPLAGSCGALDGSPSAPLDPAPAASRTHLQPLPPNPRQPRRPPSAGPGEPHCGAQRGEVGPTEASALTRAHPDQREREGTEG